MAWSSDALGVASRLSGACTMSWLRDQEKITQAAYYLAPSARALEFSATVLDRPASSSRWFSCRAIMVARPARAPRQWLFTRPLSPNFHHHQL